MIHREVQTVVLDFSDKEKSEIKFKQLNAAYQKLKNEL